MSNLVADHGADQATEDHPAGRRPFCPLAITGVVARIVTRVLIAFAPRHGNAYLVHPGLDMRDTRIVIVVRRTHARGVVLPPVILIGQSRRTDRKSCCDRNRRGSAEHKWLLRSSLGLGSPMAEEVTAARLNDP